jgi:predicted Zn finger-like uncharacterized protein
MIVQCADCKSRYQLEAAKVPQRLIRVRCPRCRAVFALDGSRAAVNQAGPASGGIRSQVTRPSQPVQPVAARSATRVDELQIERPHHAAAPAAHAAAPALDFEIERSAPPAKPPRAAAPAPAPATAVLDAPSRAKAPAADPSSDKARRLARALVSDILVYHRDARDRALADGTLVQTLGQEIKKSWEVYKERVTPEVANSTNHFREALNDILANGQHIF